LIELIAYGSLSMVPLGRSSSHTSLPDLASEGEANKPSASASNVPNGGDAEASDEDSLDDLDLMICHEDFPNLLTLVAEVKCVKVQQQNCGYAADYYQRIRPEKARSALSSEEVLGAIERMQEQISVKNVIIRRGSYPLTDAMMDDNFTILRRELNLCRASLAAGRQANGPRCGSIGPHISPHQAKTVMSPGENSTSSNEACIAVKYSKWQSDILMNWVVENKANPFPDPQEIQSLASQTGLSHSQVVNWTTNVRKRNRKATLGGKKPHHFIDFMFLAQDRDEKRCSKKCKTDKVDLSRSTATTPPRRRQQRLTTSLSVPRQMITTPSSYSTPTHHHHHFAYPNHAAGYHPHCYSHYSLPHGPSSNYNGYYAYTTPSPPPPPVRYSPVVHEGRRLTREKKTPDGTNWRGKLNSVSTSFEDATLEPVPRSEAVDESALHDFANFWGPGQADRDNPPSTESQNLMKESILPLELDDETRDETNANQAESIGEEEESMMFEHLERATVDPPNLNRESSFLMEWEEFDIDYLQTVGQIVGKRVAL
jgi:hypothetical protein